MERFTILLPKEADWATMCYRIWDNQLECEVGSATTREQADQMIALRISAVKE